MLIQLTHFFDECYALKTNVKFLELKKWLLKNLIWFFKSGLALKYVFKKDKLARKQVKLFKNKMIYQTGHLNIKFITSN